ncbi:MAG: EF-hand domain-containing protein [Thioalkalispiraceae bacterium]|jgi:hypothetical protein
MFDWIDVSAWKASILAADNIEFMVWTLIGGGITLFSGFGIFHNLRRARVIEDTPTSKIRSAVQGYVELIGVGQYFNDTPVLAPLTLSECIWYQYMIEKKEVRHTKRGSETYWRTVESKSSPEYFKLLDDTGHCVVNPHDAEVHPAIKNTWYGHSRWPSKASVMNARKNSFFNSGDYRYTEKRIHHGDALYALGNFRTVGPDADAQTIKQSVSRLLNIWKGQQQALLEKFDTNQDGEIDLQEWEQVRNAAKKHVMRDRLKRAVEPVTHLLQKTGERYRPFIISTRPQKALTRRYRIFAAISLLVFIITAPLFIWMLLVRF